MKKKVRGKVCKQYEKLPQKDKEAALEQMKNIDNAETLNGIPNMIPMQGTNEPYYRIKFGAYRYLLYHDRETDMVRVLSLLHRKDAYKKQNLPWVKG